jgi:transaldolase
MPVYRSLLDETLVQHPKAALDETMDRLLVRFGVELLSLLPGRVSTEVDARLSFDADATLARARRITQLYQAQGIDTQQRVLIKIAATWEGIQAAQVLEREGIHTNLTLLFAFAQAVACAQAGVKLISPFVGRIYDWHKKAAGATWNEAERAGANDPGVQSVRQIYNYYKQHGVATEVMGASFRNTGQITALAGCDLLTIAPELLAQLQAQTAPLSASLSVAQAQATPIERLTLNEAQFRFALNEDAMASDKLAEGIRAFCADARKLDALMQA